MRLDRSFINVMILSWGFMLLFTAFQTLGNIEKTVLDSIHNDDPNFTGEAYVSLAMVYAAFAICNWLAPSYISVTGPRVAILTGACCYILFLASFLWPQTVLLYAGSCIIGLGAALIWTGHGQYLTENSDSSTMSRNTGIFWVIFQFSIFAGNIFVYYEFKEPKIDASQREFVFSVLTGVGCLGTCLLVALRKVSHSLVLGEAEGVSSADKELRIPEPARKKPLLAAWNALADALTLFITPRMLLLSLMFLYTGLLLTFYSGVYSSSIGFTKVLGEFRKSLVGLSGIFIGIGEVIGGIIFGICGTKVSRVCGVWSVVITGFCVNLFAFITIFLNLPNDSPFTDTDSPAYITTSPILAMAGSLALGFGDACFNTQIYSLLGTMYVQQSASAFAVFKFCQSIATAISFAYSTVASLYTQLFILAISNVIATVTFCYVEHKMRAERENSHSESDLTSD